MKSALLTAHLIFAGLWLGCVLTEALFERALLPQGRSHHVLLSHLHQKVDLWVEIPAFLMVLLTGSALLWVAALTPTLHAMVGFGLLAIGANGVCVWIVFQRAAAAQVEDWHRFDQLDHAQHKWGAVVLIALVLALVAGGLRHF